jgi:hypothetical protein
MREVSMPGRKPEQRVENPPRPDQADPGKTNLVDCRPIIAKLRAVGEAGQTPAPARRTERRGGVRYPCELEAFCQPESEDRLGVAWLARVRNISATGIALMLAHWFEPGTELSIELQPPFQAEPVFLSATVVHAKPMVYGGWILGCRFIHTLPDQELKALLDWSAWMSAHPLSVFRQRL